MNPPDKAIRAPSHKIIPFYCRLTVDIVCLSFAWCSKPGADPSEGWIEHIAFHPIEDVAEQRVVLYLKFPEHNFDGIISCDCQRMKAQSDEMWLSQVMPSTLCICMLYMFEGLGYTFMKRKAKLTETGTNPALTGRLTRDFLQLNDWQLCWV